MAQEVDSLAKALEDEFDRQTADPEVEEESEKEVEQEVSGEEASSEDSEESSEETSEVSEVSPPEHWSDEDKQAFMAMDDSGREWALRLEKNAHKGIEEKSKELKKFRDAIEPYRHLIPAGTDESKVIQNLMNAQSYLQRNPVEGIRWLMRSYGVDEKQFSPTDKGKTEDDPYVDPEIRALREEISALKDGATQNAENAHRQRQNALLAQINQFREETDDQGNLLHPHYNEVQGVMAGLLQSGRANTMDEAYEQAVWALPEYRESIVEQQAREQAEREIAERAKKAESAKKAGKSVKGKQSAKESKEPQSLRSSLEDAYDKSVRGEL